MRIVCFGDSNTYGYDPRGYFGGRYDAENRWVDILAAKNNKLVENAGMNGREIPTDGLVLPNDTEWLVIMLGTNDLLQGNKPEKVAARMTHFIDQIQLKSGKILLIAPPALQRGAWVESDELVQASAQLSTLYQSLANEKQICFTDSSNWGIPLAFDGVHFTEEGHRIFAEQLSSLLL